MDIKINTLYFEDGTTQTTAAVSGGQGTSGYSGYSGETGQQGIQGIQGESGYSGYSGQNGSNGTNGSSGYSGYSGETGQQGPAGTSGYSGQNGTNGTTVTQPTTCFYLSPTESVIGGGYISLFAYADNSTLTSASITFDSSSGKTHIASFATDTAPGSSITNSGIWTFQTNFSISGGNNTAELIYEIYRRSGATETLLFSGVTDYYTTGNHIVVTNEDKIGKILDFDGGKIVAKYYAETNSSTEQTVYLTYGGVNVNRSYFVAPIQSRDLTGGSSITALDDIPDVVLTNEASGESLFYNGTNWINQTITGGSGGGDLSRVTSTTAFYIDADSKNDSRGQYAIDLQLHGNADCSAQGTDSFLLGGIDNNITSNGLRNFIIGGYHNSGNNNRSSIIGGEENYSDKAYSMTLNGMGTVQTDAYSIVEGTNVFNLNNNVWIQSGSPMYGSSQTSRYQFRKYDVDLKKSGDIVGTSGQIAPILFKNNSINYCELDINAQMNCNSLVFDGFKCKFVIYNDNGYLQIKENPMWLCNSGGLYGLGSFTPISVGNPWEYNNVVPSINNAFATSGYEAKLGINISTSNISGNSNSGINILYYLKSPDDGMGYLSGGFNADVVLHGTLQVIETQLLTTLFYDTYQPYEPTGYPSGVYSGIGYFNGKMIYKNDNNYYIYYGVSGSNGEQWYIADSTSGMSQNYWYSGVQVSGHIFVDETSGWVAC